MELVQFLINQFFGDNPPPIVNAILNFLRSSNFDVEGFLKNFKFEKIYQVLNAFSSQNKSRTNNVRQNFGISPISNLASKEIVCSLNKYFSK